MFKRLIPALAFAALVFTAASSRAQSMPHQQWVGTWATSPMQADGINIRLFSGVTMREIVHISAGGSQIRLRFTNEFGIDPLTIADAHVALSAGGSAIQPGTRSCRHLWRNRCRQHSSRRRHLLRSSGALRRAALPMSPSASICRRRSCARKPTTLSRTRTTSSPTVPRPTRPSCRRPRSSRRGTSSTAIDVSASQGSFAIVTLGDSITDGAHSTLNANRRWPDVLAARLSQDPNLAHVAVLNEGIGGNRVVNEGAGPSAISRVDRDVLAQSGVRYVIVLESINDIGRLAHVQVPWDAITAPQLEWGLKQIADRAHEHGLKIIGATLTPYGGAGYYCDAGEQVREAVNDWIRSSGVFDGVVDFDQITRDPQNPKAFNPLYDSGDHLHPSDAGYKAMGEGIDLTLFAN